MSNTGEHPSPQGPDFQPESGASPQHGGPDQPGTDPYAAQNPQVQGQPADSAEGQPPHDGYGRPGDPQDPYAAAHQAGFTGSQEPPKPGSRLNLKAMIPIVLAIALGGWVLWSNFGGPGNPEAGDCLVMSGTQQDVEYETVDCDDSSTFSYLIGAVHEGETMCEGVSITQSRGNREVAQTLCLVENFHPGECYDFTDDVNDFVRVDCGSVTEGIRVAERIDQADAACSDGDTLWFYEDPPLTFCGEFLA